MSTHKMTETEAYQVLKREAAYHSASDPMLGLEVLPYAEALDCLSQRSRTQYWSCQQVQAAWDDHLLVQWSDWPIADLVSGGEWQRHTEAVLISAGNNRDIVARYEAHLISQVESEATDDSITPQKRAGTKRRLRRVAAEVRQYDSWLVEMAEALADYHTAAQTI